MRNWIKNQWWIIKNYGTKNAVTIWLIDVLKKVTGAKGVHIKYGKKKVIHKLANRKGGEQYRNHNR